MKTLVLSRKPGSENQMRGLAFGTKYTRPRNKSQMSNLALASKTGDQALVAGEEVANSNSLGTRQFMKMSE